MTLKESIMQSARESGAKIQSSEETALEKLINKTFFLPRNIDLETDFLRLVMTRGQDTQERKGLHASEIKESDEKFCLRRCVLSLFFKRLQGEEINVPLKRIFEEGNSIHEKYQRLFIRAGWARPHMLDRTRIDNETDLSYSPDIVCRIPDFFDGLMIGEIKSVNPRQYVKMEEHTEAVKQLQLYMYLCIKHAKKCGKWNGIDYTKGFVLCENKGNQDFKINIYDYDIDFVRPYVTRLENIRCAANHYCQDNKLPGRKSDCQSHTCNCAATCYMRDACWGCGMGRVRLGQ